jgi:26S proteasome regulatory subunit N1
MAQAVDESKENVDGNNKKEEQPEDAPEELSEEDQKLKDLLDKQVTTLTTSKDQTAVMAAIDKIGTEIRTATASMTSVPKPLKFLRPHYPTIKGAHSAIHFPACKAPLADVISVLATVGSESTDSRECLAFHLLGTGADPGDWGHEYMRHLAGEIAGEYSHRTAQEPPEPIEDLMSIVQVC